MKKAVCVLFACFIALTFSACQWAEDAISTLVFIAAIASSDDSVSKEDIVEFVNEHKSELEACEESEDFSRFEGLEIVKKVRTKDNCVDFFCGGRGLSVSGDYCGFFYSPDCDKNAMLQGDEYNSEEIFGHYYFYEVTYY